MPIMAAPGELAYADFVTAMMAFFLLLWLLNAVTEEQLQGIADYFAPTTVSTSNNGAGGMLGGQVIARARRPRTARRQPSRCRCRRRRPSARAATP